MERIQFFLRKEFHRDFNDKLELYTFLGFPDKNVSQVEIDEALITARLASHPDELAKLEAGPTNEEEGIVALNGNPDELSDQEIGPTNEAKESSSGKLANLLNFTPHDDAWHEAAAAEATALKVITSIDINKDNQISPFLNYHLCFYLIQLQVVEDILCNTRKRRLYDEVGWVGYCRLTNREVAVSQFREIAVFGVSGPILYMIDATLRS